jgi:hypothetical protein
MSTPAPRKAPAPICPPAQVGPCGVVERVVAAAVFGQQRQVHRRGHGPVVAEHRVAQLEQSVTASGEARV